MDLCLASKPLIRVCAPAVLCIELIAKSQPPSGCSAKQHQQVNVRDPFRAADTTELICGLGLKFFLLAEPDTERLDQVLQDIYVLYTDYVLKNPFYVIEMPIHCELFDKYLLQRVQARSSSPSKPVR